jgi:hypothetical protein
MADEENAIGPRIEPTFLSWSMCPVPGQSLAGWHNISLGSGVRGENVAVEGCAYEAIRKPSQIEDEFELPRYVPAKFSGNKPRVREKRSVGMAFHVVLSC